MNITDLMIGDWVTTSKWIENPFKITNVENKEKVFIYGKTTTNNCVGPFLESELQPIPITPEILEKNGFVDKGYYSELLFDDAWQIQSDCYSLRIRCTKGETEIRHISCEYVHELQHALKLCGIEKEIIL